MDAAHEGSLADVLAAAMEDDEAVVACVSAAALVAVVDAVEVADRSSPVRVLAPAGAVRVIDRDQVVAARLADLDAAGALSVRTGDPGDETVVVAGDRAVAVLTAVPDDALGVPTDDADAVEAVRAGIERRWADGDPYRPEIPAHSSLVASIGETFDDATGTDLDAALALPAVRGLEADFDLVELLVLLTARHRHQLYELTQWGSDTGVASVGTFSQAKRRLEELGLVDTETVHSGSVGRPRQRLVLGDESMAEMEVEEFLDTARRTLDA
ncbi:transcriptional regulator TbsP domain-containing protein [Halorarius halobius]|uniref:transcriptional regulator TbsP domain-containing protein n=1 Tax=Halorarius halobius TaxID=2962671 RepID=UPI0020CDBC30|nr:DUF5821 family protein [Halorarius halobius]